MKKLLPLTLGASVSSLLLLVGASAFFEGVLCAKGAGALLIVR